MCIRLVVACVYRCKVELTPYTSYTHIMHEHTILKLQNVLATSFSCSHSLSICLDFALLSLMCVLFAPGFFFCYRFTCSHSLVILYFSRCSLSSYSSHFRVNTLTSYSPTFGAIQFASNVALPSTGNQFKEILECNENNMKSLSIHLAVYVWMVMLQWTISFNIVGNR